MTDETKSGAMVQHDGGSRELATTGPVTADNVLAMVLSAARDPAINADNVKTMADLAMKMQDRALEAEFNRDLNAAKKEMPSIARDGSIKNSSGNVQSRFSSWEKLNPIVSAILHRYNLTIGHEVGSTDKGFVAVTPILTHDNGMERRGKEMSFPPDTSGNKSPAQAVVSSSSYGQRVTTIKLLNIRTHDAPDNDGQSASADPYDMLNPNERALVDEGRREALNGMESYAAWFKRLGTDQRGFLAYNKSATGASWHDQNKAAAEQV